MDPKGRKELWKNENNDSIIDQFIIEFIEELKKQSKSNMDSFILKNLREILEEKEIFEE